VDILKNLINPDRSISKNKWKYGSNVQPLDGFNFKQLKSHQYFYVISRSFILGIRLIFVAGTSAAFLEVKSQGVT